MVQSHKSNTRRCCGSAATSTSNARLWRRQAAQRSAAQSSAEVIDPHPHLQLPRAEIPGSALPNVTCRALQPHFFFFPGKAEQSLTVSGEAQVKALPIGGDSFLLLLNSLRSRIVGTRGTNPTPYSSISTNKIRTPSQGCNREGLLVFRLRLYPPDPRRWNRTSARTFFSVFIQPVLHSQYQSFVAIMSPAASAAAVIGTESEYG